MAKKSLQKKEARLKEKIRLSELRQAPPNLPQSKIQSSQPKKTAQVSTTVIDNNRHRARSRMFIKKEWYGYQILFTELLDIFYGIPYLFAAPIVHLHHGEKGNAVRSLLVRLILPSVGFAVGSNAFSNGGWIPTGVVMAFVGAVIAVAYDISVIAYKSILHKKIGIITPTLGEPTPRGSGYEQSTLFNLNFSF